jgi:hypothetical protein
MVRTFVKGFWLFVGSASLVWGVVSERPEKVAQAFWRAVAAHRSAEANGLTVRGDFHLSLPLPVTIEKVTVEEGNTTGSVARVPTLVTYGVEAEGMGRMECNATFATELLKLEKGWRVDDVVTAERFDEAVRASVLACGTRAIDRLMKEGMAQFDELRRAMEEGGEWNEAMQNFMERMKGQMVEEMRKMQRLMERAWHQSTPDAPHLPPPEEGDRI